LRKAALKRQHFSEVRDQRPEVSGGRSVACLISDRLISGLVAAVGVDVVVAADLNLN
jgi:hypothetical protein